MRIRLDDRSESLCAGPGIYNKVCSINEHNNDIKVHTSTDFISFGSIA